jgi:hypothetical protein
MRPDSGLILRDAAKMALLRMRVFLKAAWRRDA